jgi:hypothetical protein
MKTNLLNEINEMKFLFGYKPGKVMSEQKKIKNIYEDMDMDIEMNEPDVLEPDVKPKTRPRPETPDTDPFPNPFDPERGKEFNPLPDAEPQGRRRDRIDSLNSRKRPGSVPGLRGVSKDEVSEPFIDDVEDEPEYELHLDNDVDDIFPKKRVDLEDFVSKYLSKKDEPIYEIHLYSDINELF